MSEEDVGGRLDESKQAPEVREELDEAKEAHAEQQSDPGATAGHGVEPEGTGYAPPDTGQGDAATSEIPEGVDALSDEQIRAAEERGGGDEEGGGDALDVSAIMQEGGTADETGDDAAAMTDPESQVAANTDEDA